MTIRPASIADIEVIRQIAHGAWPVAYGSILSQAQLAYMLDRMYSAEALLHQMTEQGHVFLMATSGDRTAIGFAAYSTNHGNTRRTRLHKLYLLPEAKGTGTGKTLLKAVMDASRAAKDEGVNLNVNRYNAAVDFYKSQGFSVVKEEVLDIGSGYVMDDFVMERPTIDPPRC